MPQNTTQAQTQAAPQTPPPLAQKLDEAALVSHSPDSPPDAEDNDLIEQEWVNKAKDIVERTLEDPYQQNKELSLFKADYMKKRFKRDIKVTEAK